MDVNHISPTELWFGGTFASFHAYPYYPDFLRFEYQDAVDPFKSYLTSLREVHPNMPLLITEIGLPTSSGIGHRGPLGRDQGGNTELEQGEKLADLIHVVHDSGCDGAFLFE